MMIQHFAEDSSTSLCLSATPGCVVAADNMVPGARPLTPLPHAMQLLPSQLSCMHACSLQSACEGD